MKKIISVFALVGALVLGGCDRGAKSGDTVVIDFAGFLGDVQFEGGTAENFKLKLGSGMFVPGFEDQLIGAKKGEERDVKITFPEQYVPGLAGKDVVFKVKVLNIERGE
jgi:trigger factor